MKKSLCERIGRACIAIIAAMLLVACLGCGNGQNVQKEALPDADGTVNKTDKLVNDDDESEANDSNGIDITETDEKAETDGIDRKAQDEAEVSKAVTNSSSRAADTKYVADTEVLTIQDAEADYSGLKPIPVYYPYASSQLEDNSESYGKYSTDNMFDNDLSTAFVEGAEGDGIGQMIKVPFDDNRSYEISKIKIYPGYQKDAKTFKNNSRPTKLSFCFPDGHYFVQEFDYGDATKGYFEIDLKKIFSENVVAHYCVITIEDAVKGDKFEDCCISEVEFYEPETVSDDVILIKYEGGYKDGAETCLIKASRGGKSIWEYECKTDRVTELSGTQYIATANGTVFVQDDWKVIALDAMTGDVVWKGGGEHEFSASAEFYDVATGNIYLSGYYGPDIIGFDKDGNDLDFEGLDEDCYWPCMMKPVITDFEKWYNGEGIDHVKIFFDGSMSIEDYDL